MATTWNRLGSLTALAMVGLGAQPGHPSGLKGDPTSVTAVAGEPQRHTFTSGDQPEVRVGVMDAVRLDAKMLAAALDKAQVIFRDAGVRLIWLKCPGANPASDLNQCQADDTNKLFLRIVRQPASGFGSRHALGQAFAGAVGSQYATVFHDRVLAMVASRKPGSEALVLGHVIAHELGHLMLGTSVHASFGLMAARWSAAELERAPAGLLEFSSAEAAIIRAEALRRAQQPSISQKP